MFRVHDGTAEGLSSLLVGTVSLRPPNDNQERPTSLVNIMEKLFTSEPNDNETKKDSGKKTNQDWSGIPRNRIAYLIINK